MWLFAAVLLAAETGALAHELDHVFGKHNVPCAQHALIDNLGKMSATALTPAVVVTTEEQRPTVLPALQLPVVFTPYRVRAPPVFSVA